MFKRILFVIALIISLVLICGCEVTVSTEDEYTSIHTLDSGRIIFPAGIAAGDIATYLLALQEDKNYHIIIDSFGGSAMDTIAIINRLQELQSDGFTITTETYGYTLSGGAFIFIIGDRRIIHSGATLMFHGAGFSQYGVRQSLRELVRDGKTEMKPEHVKALTIVDNEFIAVLSEWIGLSDDEIRYWLYELDANFMSADEAMELGIATELK